MIIPRRRGHFSHFVLEEGADFGAFAPQPDPLLPEKRLLVAILERAIADALYSTGRLTHEGDAARYEKEGFDFITIYTPMANPRAFSYQWICHELDLDPQVITALVIKAKEGRVKFIRGKNRVNHPPVYKSAMQKAG